MKQVRLYVDSVSDLIKILLKLLQPTSFGELKMMIFFQKLLHHRLQIFMLHLNLKSKMGGMFYI